MKIYLNVLPEEKKNKARFQRLFERVLHQEFLIFIIGSFLMMLLGLLWYGLDHQLKNLENIAVLLEESQENYKELKMIEEAFGEANERARHAEVILNTNISWTRSFQEMGAVLPPLAHINSLSFNADRTAMIEGVALTRDVLKEFDKNLEENICFTDVVIPTSAFAQKEDIAFQIDFKIHEDCI